MDGACLPANGLTCSVLGGLAGPVGSLCVGDNDQNGPDDACGGTPCVSDTECLNPDVCNCGKCIDSLYTTAPRQYGDLDCDGDIDLFDLFCVLNGFGGDFTVCSFVDVDIEPCAGDGDLDLFDLFGVLNAFGGVNACNCLAVPALHRSQSSFSAPGVGGENCFACSQRPATITHRLIAIEVRTGRTRMADTTWTCKCGVSYRVPALAVGWRVRCKKCGLVSALPEPDPIPLAAEKPAPPPQPHRPSDLDVIIKESEPAAQPPLRHTSFGSDVIYSFVFFIEPASLGPLMIVWFFNSVMLGFLWSGMRVFSWSLVLFLNIALLAVGLLMFGWLCSYYMRIINEVADDEDELPSTLMGGAWESVLKPLFVFVATWFCLLLPAIVMMYMKSLWNLNIPYVWIWAALVFAVIMWPMAVLCVSIGGITVFARADLMVYSVLRTLGSYTMVWILLLVTGACGYYLFKVTTVGGAGGASLLSRHVLAGRALLTLILAYGSIVAMRVIGLYYRHFKNRFAWSWE